MDCVCASAVWLRKCLGLFQLQGEDSGGFSFPWELLYSFELVPWICADDFFSPLLYETTT